MVMSFTRALLVMGAFASFLGCADRSTTEVAAPSASTETGEHAHGEHAHSGEGPHHGTLVELGNEELHAELIHDAASVTVYILDGSAQKSIAVDAEVAINLLHDGKPEQFKLAAQPAEGDAPGKSSCYVSTDLELAAHLEDEASTPKLSLSIAGTSYRGEIHHDHDHDHAHDHAHDHDSGK